MKEEMEELYTEGLASQGGPEPCGHTSKGVVEALDGGTCRRAIEPRCGPKAAVPAGESPASVITQSALK